MMSGMLDHGMYLLTDLVTEKYCLATNSPNRSRTLTDSLDRAPVKGL